MAKFPLFLNLNVATKAMKSHNAVVVEKEKKGKPTFQHEIVLPWNAKKKKNPRKEKKSKLCLNVKYLHLLQRNSLLVQWVYV